MKLRGRVTGDVSTRTVSTSGGKRELAEVTLRDVTIDRSADDAASAAELGQFDDGDAEPVTTVTLWGKWTETASLLESGMELVVTEPAVEEYRGEIQYSTTGESYVVVEPDYLVDVTDVRSWVECPRLYYLNKLSGVPLNYPVLKGTLVHEVFGDLLRGRDLEESIDARIEERALELGLLGEDAESVAEDVRENAAAIEGWLAQGRLSDDDEWRSEQLLISETFGLKGRADAIRRGAPVELKTGKNLKKEPRFKDKVQAALYALVLEEHGGSVDTATLLYTKNSALDRNEETGDLTPAKDFSVGRGLLAYVLRLRNELAAMAVAGTTPTGYEADAKCEYCFERDTCMVVSGRLDQESKAGQIGEALPPEERAFFERFYRGIEAERREVHREYVKLFEQSADERADDDRAIIDLTFAGATELEGGRWELRAERGAVDSTKIREGDLVLASDGDPVGGSAELARIERLDADELVLTADERVPVERVDVYPSELTTDRLLTALHDVLLTSDERRKDVLFGRADPEFDDPDETFVDNNAAQDEAVGLAVGARDYALIHGPPGTGKTYTIAKTVEALLDRGERVLLSAFTNRAVDNALEALLDAGIDPDRIARMGTERGVREDMRDLRFEREGSPAERVAALNDSDVVAVTTATCGSRVMKEQSFDVALVDEAAQLTEPGTYAAIHLASRFVLVGDHQQLPPVVQAETLPAPLSQDESGEAGSSAGDPVASGGDQVVSDGAGESIEGTPSGDSVEAAPSAGTVDADDGANPLTVSLFERLADATPEAGVLLDRQYRMNQRIQAFSSTEFYDGALRPATPAVAGRTVDDLDGVSRERLPADLVDPVTFLHVDGDAATYTDAIEADRIASVVDAYASAGLDPADIGVIAPYRAQVGEIERAVPSAVAVDTVDRFQGSSQEVIVVSFVASDDLSGPIFEDYRRLNVAITRPKRALVLVGDEAALETDPVYRRLLEWAA
ncbi:AAA domain-containing protein [Halovivax limisalsi]|uniref:AAA domain-containing protein n=1 Tax=Halovivax limisalsi TaxID=1453760 RepID=UPI001FFDD9A7|nr:AAA domain-containing protein [Halovivax limisalsi]